MGRQLRCGPAAGASEQRHSHPRHRDRRHQSSSLSREGTAIPDLHLTLFGPAHLDLHGRTVKLQRKGLALLYLLALEGPTRRERAADLLWGHEHALRNLRVELHAVRKAFRSYGVDAFGVGGDPLKLPDSVRLDRTRRPGQALEGLEDLSNEFQDWLEQVRERHDPGTAKEPLFTEVAVELVDSLRLPFLLVLEGPPFSGRRELARQIATRLDLPFRIGSEAAGRAVRYLPADTPHSTRLVDDVVSDRLSLWVLERSSFGEDPSLLLALRERYPAQRSRYLRMPRVGWHDAYERRLGHLQFRDAARVYLASGGLPGYLDELIDMTANGGAGAPLPVPQRVRAAFQLELRRLSVGARGALERLAPVEHVLPEELVDALGIYAHLPELERSGWLLFDEGWRFASQMVRRLVWDGLSPGQRSRYRAEARRLLRDPGVPGGSGSVSERVLPEISASGGIGRVRVGVASAPRELEPVEAESGATWSGGRLWWPSVADDGHRAEARFQLPEGRQLLHLSAEAYFDGDARSGLLRITPRYSGQRAVLLAPETASALSSDGSLTLKAEGPLDLWFLLPHGGPVDVGFWGSGLVVSLGLSVATPAADGEHARRVVLAHDLAVAEAEQRPRPEQLPVPFTGRGTVASQGGGRRVGSKSRAATRLSPSAESLVTVLDASKDQNH